MIDPVSASPMPEPARITVIRNKRSGRHERDEAAIDAAIAAMGPGVRLVRIGRGQDITDAADRAIAEGQQTIVAAGGDGTVVAVAEAVANTGARLGVLPLGTFNFFARGLDVPLDPGDAGRVIAAGHTMRMPLARIDEQAFLNNASLGIYPAILKTREGFYRQLGRRQIVAYWSVIRTFLQFQRPMRLTIELPDATYERRTPLVFIARSAYQLKYYELKGVDTIERGRFAIFVAPDEGRWGLFKQAWRLITRNMRAGRDFELIEAERATIHTSKRRVLVACDGEKLMMSSPLRLTLAPDALEVIVPEPT